VNKIFNGLKIPKKQAPRRKFGNPRFEGKVNTKSNTG